MIGTLFDVVDKALLFFIQGARRLFSQQSGKTYNRVERSAQFVAHACQELALHLGCTFDFLVS